MNSFIISSSITHAHFIVIILQSEQHRTTGTVGAWEADYKFHCE